MKMLTFANQDQMPILGLGTWKSAPNEVYGAVREALRIGYRHLDCAAIYGNEQEVGRAIREAIAEGSVTREALWVTSKLWNNGHGREQVIPALQRTLADLGLDYLDLYLIHWPIAQQPDKVSARSAADFIALADCPLTATWQGMEAAQAAGLVRHIGVSNFNARHLTQLLEGGQVKPAMNQIELHPYLQQPALVAFCQEHGIHLTAYSPLGSADRPAGLKAADEPILLEDPIIVQLARQHQATPAQVLISWSIHRGIAVIPKSVNPGRLRENFAAAELHLSAEDLRQLATLDRGRRYVDGKFWEVPDGPYTLAELWG
ncbi:MAG: aldehyde oxidoreductase [Bacteroidetes bacterium]|nr:MAG: aldehyde oxidoreductase [Bacteroidota bacterium]PTM12100.1 MAG: aldehyde oxidoreductase [Bacteroidota bacterium]